MIYGYCFMSKIGQMYILEQAGSIIEIGIGCPVHLKVIQKETPMIKETIKQLSLYFDNKLTTFSLPLKVKGTPFQEKVWQALIEIPYGETRSYEAIAKAINHDKAARAVGQACHNNPILIAIPCHRVIGKNHQLVGFGHDIGLKAYLIDLEKKVHN